MALHDKIGENDLIDSDDNPVDVVAYEPTEVKAERPEERSDEQRIRDEDPEIEIESSEDDIDVSPHAVWKPEVKEEKPSEEEEEEEEESTSEEEEEEKQEEVKEKKPAEKKKKTPTVDPVQKRINKITREKYDAIRAADKLKKELAEAKKKLEETKFEKKKSDLIQERPKESDFDTDEEYHIALGRWAAKTEIHETQAPQEEVEEEKQEEVNPVQKIIDVGKETYPDFEELVLTDDLRITPLMVEAAADSEHASDIFYHLGQNPKLAEKIAKERSPSKVAREMGRIELEFLGDEVEEVVAHEPEEDTEVLVRDKKGKLKKKKEAAPPPVKPLGGGGKVKKSLEDMNLADYYEARGYTRDGFKKSRIPK